MNPEEPVPEVMRRTMVNLRFIDKHKSPGGPYEVTQLVNSFLGALAHPWEKYKRVLSEISIDEAEELGWPKVSKEREQDCDPTDLADLLRLLRNGIAHGNMVFLPDEQNEIRAVKLWNTHPRSGKRTWGTILTVKVMRELLDRFVEEAEQIHKHYTGAREQSA